MMLPDVTEDELIELYSWLDTIPFSRAKKSIARDFADGVCVAEIIHHYFPRLVQLHNYSPASNSAQKMYNWNTLNERTFKKLDFTLPKESMKSAAFAEVGAIERILKLLRTKLAQHQAKHGASRASASASAAYQDTLHSPPPPLANTNNSRCHMIFAADLDHQFPSQHQEKKKSMHDHHHHHHHIVEHESGLIQSYPGDEPAAAAAAVAEEIERLHVMHQISEEKAAKLEQLLRLKEAKIAALTARLQSAGLLSP